MQLARELLSMSHGLYVLQQLGLVKDVSSIMQLHVILLGDMITLGT